MKEFIEKLIGRLEEEQKLADEVKEKCARENPLMFDNAKGYSTGIFNVIYIVNELAEEYNNGWIPCSERLPEAGKRYLVSAIWKDEDFEKHSVYDAVYGTDGIWHTYEYKPIMYEVIAWMPLPEAYQG